MAKGGKSGGRRSIAKSSVTGRIVSPRYAKTHPKTTYVTKVK